MGGGACKFPCGLRVLGDVFGYVNDMLLTSSVHVVGRWRGRRDTCGGPFLRLPDGQVLHKVVDGMRRRKVWTAPRTLDVLVEFHGLEGEGKKKKEWILIQRTLVH